MNRSTKAGLAKRVVKKKALSSKAEHQLLNKAKRALKLADGIMEYCGGDSWERECTAKDREKYQKLFKEIFGAGSSA